MRRLKRQAPRSPKPRKKQARAPQPRRTKTTSRVDAIPRFVSRERVADAIEAPLRTDTNGPQVDDAIDDVHALINRTRLQVWAGRGLPTSGALRRQARDVLKLLTRLDRFAYSAPWRFIQSLTIPLPRTAIRTGTDPMSDVLACVSKAIALLGKDIERDGSKGGRPATTQRLREALRSIFVAHQLPVDTIVFDHTLDEVHDMIRAR